MQADAEYMESIRQMALKARAWRAAHPDLEAKVQFNYHPRVMLIAPISSAIKEHFVSVNPAGQQIIDAMGAGLPEEKEPTAFMVRMAIDFLDDPSLC